MQVFIMSFNRGVFLENCYNSVRKHIPNADITIYDDNSNDILTIKILEQISKDNIEIKYSKFNKSIDQKIGGLTSNLNDILSNLALEDYVLVLEDDIQILRDVTDNDFENIRLYFNKYQNSLCLYPGFFKNDEPTIDAYMTKDNLYYFNIDENDSRFVNFSYPGIWNAKLFRESKLKLNQDMDINRLFIRERFSSMGRYVFPFMMYLPFPSSIKFGSNSTLRAIIERIDGFGFHPYSSLDSAKVILLLTRNLDNLPFVTDFVCVTNSKRVPYYGDALYRQPLFIWRLYRLELRIRELFKKLLD